MDQPHLCEGCEEAQRCYYEWQSSHCQECYAELEGSELEAVNYGCQPLCSLCSDRHYYLGEQGQRELRDERLEREAQEARTRATEAEQKLSQIDEAAVVKLKGRALAAEAERDQLLSERRAEQERLQALEAEVERLRAAYPVQPGPRSRRSPLGQ
jgi:uncharacterized protein YuzB (UPF0349 family)